MPKALDDQDVGFVPAEHVKRREIVKFLFRLFCVFCGQSPWKQRALTSAATSKLESLWTRDAWDADAPFLTVLTEKY